MNNKLLAALLTGTALVSGMVGAVTDDVLEGKETIGSTTEIQEEQIEAVQPLLVIDEKCAQDSLLLRIGTAEMCTSEEVYEELKQIIIDDLKVEDTTWQTEDGKECKEGEEGCKGTVYDLDINNRELFSAVLLKEMIKTGEIKNLSTDRVEAKAEALAILGVKEDIEIIK